MNVIFIANRCKPNVGGVQRHLDFLCIELANRGHCVTVIASANEQSDNCTCLDLHATQTTPYRRIIFGESSHPFLTKCKALFVLIHYFKLLWTADVVHFHDYKVLIHWALPIAIALRLFHRKIFITFHGWEGICPPKRSVIYQRRFAELICSGVISVGNYIDFWYGTRSDIVIYGGVRATSSEPDEAILCGQHTDKKSSSIVFVGRLEADSSVLRYLDAWKQLYSIFPDHVLYLCGDGILRSIIEQRVAHGEYKKVILLGNVTHPEEYIQQASVVLTSGYLAMLEVMSLGKPLVTVYENPLKEDYLRQIPGAEKMFWVCGSAVEIVTAINKIISQPDCTSDKVMLGKKFALENSWSHVAESYISLWDRAI